MTPDEALSDLRNNCDHYVDPPPDCWYCQIAAVITDQQSKLEAAEKKAAQYADYFAMPTTEQLKEYERTIEALKSRLGDCTDACNVWRRENAEIKSRLHSAELLLSETIEYLPIGGTEQIRAKVERYFRPAVVERPTAR